MKTITKTSKAILFALLAMIICVAMALTACNGNNTPPNNGDDDDTTATVITKYDATFDASIVMGPMGEQSFASVFSDAYVTKKNNQYSLTVIFTAGELNVGGIKGTIFIDNKPTTEETVSGIKDGTIGCYKADGTLVTEGIKVTYSSGDNYALNSAQQNVYYVQSVEFPVDALRATYDLTLYINSNMMGKQFIKGVHDAKITLDLESGEVVNAITGLGVDTLGTVIVEPETVEPVADKYTKYSAELKSVVSMGQNVDFTENLFDGIYAIKKNDKYEVTLIFKSGVVNMPFGNTMTGFLTSAESVDYGGNTVTPVFGYYNGENRVTDGVTLTYSSGDNYVTIKDGSYYYVQSMTFTVDKLEDNYILAIFVMAGNDSSASSMQFPYTLKSGAVSNAELTIDLTDAETVNSIDSLLGVDTLGTVVIEPETVEPVADKYTKYSAQLNAIISMGQNVNFTENLFDGVYVIKKDSKYEITLVFNSGEVNMPFGNKMAGFLTNSQCPGYRGGEPFMPVWGYYNEETLVKEGISLTYSSGDEYVTVSEGSYYYVQSMTFAVDSLEEEYILSLCVMAGNETSTSGQQFPYTSSNGTVCNATLTIDLTDAETVNSIDNLLGVDTLGAVPA